MTSRRHSKSTGRRVNSPTTKYNRRIVNRGNLYHLFDEFTIVVGELTSRIGELACRRLGIAVLKVHNQDVLKRLGLYQNKK